MRQTEKYQLNLIDPSDNFLPAPINENTEKVEAALSACARIATGSYVGTGTYGADAPCTLTFDFNPKFVMVYENNMGHLTGHSNGTSFSYALIAAYGARSAIRHSYINSSGNFTSVTDHFTWNDNSFSWYSTAGSSSTVTKNGTVQLNNEGTTYHYLAIG